MKILINLTTNPGILKTELDVPGNSKNVFHLICDIFSFDLEFQCRGYEFPKNECRVETALYRKVTEIVSLGRTDKHFVALTGDIEFDTAEKFKQHLSALFPNAI